ncbi:unnamed protein product [Orchesella dallaii]|uniref:Transcription factor 25 n=1 Tax=Orchesella dallaii TaxID=48710 RepID=A0ABP1QF58_9HEXA
MSNRVVKKVYGDKDKELKVSPDSEDEVPVAFGASAVRAARNPYELLNELSESEAKEDDGQPDGEGHKSGDSSRMDDDASQGVAKKKKKRRRPGRSKKRATMGSGSDRAMDTELEDELTLQQRSRTRHPPSHHQSLLSKEKKEPAVSKELQAFEQVFKIDNKLLNPEFELKKIFGAKVINYERGKQGQRRVYRQTRLIDPRDNWRSVVGAGISMSFVESNKQGYMYFKFEHNKEYQEVQKQFIRAVNTLNPDNIVTILKVHPYHIDSHIQLSDMAKSAEDMQVAAELIEGALYCLENAFHARFNLAVPSCRLDYKYQENRAFFVLLFKHLTFVGQRACHRTALELCKRLLSLDPDNDPLCTTLMVDFYAIKAGEARWLVDLYHYWEKSKNLLQLPNFAYSVGLAYHLLSTKKPESTKTTVEKAGGNSSSTQQSPEDLAKQADKLIQYAILMFPSIILPLLEKCGIQVDTRTKSHNFFNAIAQNSQTRSLKLLCDLYVWRTHHVWKDSTVLAWLEKNVQACLDRVDAKDSIVRDYEEKRKRRYMATIPRNIIRHVLLTDNKDLSVNLPPELSREPILNYDPLPPPDTIDIYNTRDLRSLEVTSNQPRNGLLSMLFRSFLYDLNDPNVPFPLEENAAAAAVLAERNAAGGGVGAGLQQSVTALLDAMRDLLTNVNPRAEGEAADGDESENT